MDVSTGAGILYMSDVHWDATTCNRKLLKAQLDEAKEKGYPIVIVGDLFDAMQGRFDPRKSMEELRPEFRRDDYFDVVIDSAAEWFKPWAANLAIIGYGNHETSIVRHNGTDLLDRFCYKMRSEYDSQVVKGGYETWHLIRFIAGKKKTIMKTIIGRYYHGKGGSAPVTKGVIQTNRQAVYLDGVDIVVNGHNHNGYITTQPKRNLSIKGIIRKSLTLYLRTPGYKTYNPDALMGFDIEKGSPKPNGAILVQFGIKGSGSYDKRFFMRAETWIV